MSLFSCVWRILEEVVPQTILHGWIGNMFASMYDKINEGVSTVRNILLHVLKNE